MTPPPTLATRMSPLCPFPTLVGSLAARLHRFFERGMTPFLAATGGARRRHLLFASMAGLVLLAGSLAAFELVVMKMLPFDNKSELQVVVDLPEGRTLEDTGALHTELAAIGRESVRERSGHDV